MTVVPEQGGRFDFDDGGSYIGDWQDGRAHGLGVCTGPRGQGEYAGQWMSGFESCGVYIWPSGNTYAGTWTKGKRHGEGVEVKGRWIYRGEWTTGFKGRYGTREATNTCARYEGTWAAGFQDGSGVETYSDGGTYAGQWQQGTRHGYGVRQSVPYGLASRHANPRALRESLTSVRSIDEPDTEVKESERKLDEGRSGFVLHGLSFQCGGRVPGQRRMTLSSRHRNWRRNFALKFRRPFSTGDIETSPSLGAADSLRSTSVASHAGETHSLLVSTASELTAEAAYNVMDPDITEIYRGEWRNDKRTGFGVCERTDGLRYEGEWYNNKRFGYGVTTFPDKTREEGKYRDNVLVSTYKKSRFVHLRPGRLRERIDMAIREARRAAYMAMQKADISRQRQSQAKEKAVASEYVSKEAHHLAEKARSVALRYVPNFRLKGAQAKPETVNKDTASTKPSNRKSLRKLRKQDSVVQDDYVPSSHHDLYPHDAAAFDASAGRAGGHRADFRLSHFDADAHDAVYCPPPSSSAPLHQQFALHAPSPDLPPKRQLRDRSARHSPVSSAALSTYHYEQYSSAPISKRDSGLGRDSSLEESVPSSSGLGALARWESDTPDSGMSDISQLSRGSRARRRGQPAFLTYPPVEVGYSSAEEEEENDVDRLTVIIEDGVRKVVPCLDEEDLRTPTALSADTEFDFPTLRRASGARPGEETARGREPEEHEPRAARTRRHNAQEETPGPRAKGALLETCHSDSLNHPNKPDREENVHKQRSPNIFNLTGMVALAVTQYWIHALKNVNVFQAIHSIKNWFVKNLVVLLVLAVNSVLAFLFFRLLNTNGG